MRLPTKGSLRRDSNSFVQRLHLDPEEEKLRFSASIGFKRSSEAGRTGHELVRPSSSPRCTPQKGAGPNSKASPARAKAEAERAAAQSTHPSRMPSPRSTCTRHLGVLTSATEQRSIPYQPLTRTHPAGITGLWFSIVTFGGNRARSASARTAGRWVLDCHECGHTVPGRAMRCSSVPL